MPTRHPRALACLLLLVFAACVQEPPTRPSAPEVSVSPGVPTKAALTAQVNGLIRSLFAPRDQGQVLVTFARIRAQLAKGETSAAQGSIVTFVGQLLAARDDGLLLDPNGAQPPTTEEALRDLVNAVAVLGDLPPPLPDSNPLSDDGAVAVIGPTGGEVVASSGFGGVTFPSGALPEDVIVVVERLPNPPVAGAGPLPTTLNQYPLFYDFSTVPHVPQFGAPVTVGICQLEVGDQLGPPTQAVANRLQLAHPDPNNPGTVELLAREVAPFLNCSGVTLSQAGLEAGSRSVLGQTRALLGWGGRRMLGVLRPSVAHAVHGGLGGKTTSFSPFGAVDPGVITAQPGILAVGQQHGCLIEAGGTTVCWGSDVNGAVGDGPPTGGLGLTRVPVAGSPAFIAIAGNGSYPCGETAAGAFYCWGRNPAGGVFPNAPTLLPFGPYIQVSTARLTACALTPALVAECWGINQRGEVGDGTQTFRSTPVPVATGLTFASVEAGWTHSCALTPAGSPHCWGQWQGIFATPDLSPVPVPGGHTFVRLYAGATHTCGRTATDEAWCWGDNGTGQLGNGTTVSGGTPVQVGGGHLFAVMTAGTIGGPNHSCGISTSGVAYCWGLNDQGQLGDGTTTNRSLPVPVLTSETFVAIDAGDRFTCAATPDRRVFCWGTNTSGELGNGSVGGFSAVPLQVP